jgi:hypothetical protein
VFFAGGREYLTLVAYKGVPQGSVLSSFLYNVIGSCADRFVPAGCGFLQYADDLEVYVANRLIEVARGLIHTACTSLDVFFFNGYHNILLKVRGLAVFPKTRAPSDSD